MNFLKWTPHPPVRQASHWFYRHNADHNNHLPSKFLAFFKFFLFLSLTALIRHLMLIKVWLKIPLFAFLEVKKHGIASFFKKSLRRTLKMTACSLNYPLSWNKCLTEDILMYLLTSMAKSSFQQQNSLTFKVKPLFLMIYPIKRGLSSVIELSNLKKLLRMLELQFLPSFWTNLFEVFLTVVCRSLWLSEKLFLDSSSFT